MTRNKIVLPASGIAAVAFFRSTPKWIPVATSTELMQIRTKMVKLAGEFAPVGQENLHALFD
jgi:hypothetical protein